jgi:hypothetical protein
MSPDSNEGNIYFSIPINRINNVQTSNLNVVNLIQQGVARQNFT